MQGPEDSRLSGGPAIDSLGVLFRIRSFNFYLATRVVAQVGGTVGTAATAWQVYDLTGSALPLAMVGVARFVPNITLSFLGGALADMRDRRMIVGVSQLAPLLTGILLWLLTAAGTITVEIIYLTAAIIGIAAAFQGPAQTSLLPQLVPATSFQRANTVTTMSQKLSGIFGPAAAGILIAGFGLAPAYFVRVVLLLVGLILLAAIRVDAETNPRGTLSVAFVKEGFAFMWTHKPVLAAMTLDLLAETFASAEALLPIYASEILGVGVIGFGLLNSSKAIGGLGMSTALTLMPPIASSGKVLVITVICYALATVAFGFSTWFPLSLLLYGLIAAIDQVSVVTRQNIIQLGTPNELRGRVNSVNQVFVGASGHLGAVESGVVATLTGSAMIAVVTGGLGCLAAVGIMMALVPSLWKYRMELNVPRAAEVK